MNFETILKEFGLPGVVIGGLAWFVLYLMKQHRQERKEWKGSSEKLQDDTNKNMRESINVLSGLKTLIETLKR